MRTEQDIKAKYDLYKTHLTTFSHYMIATSQDSRNQYLIEKGMVEMLEWVLNEED